MSGAHFVVASKQSGCSSCEARFPPFCHTLHTNTQTESERRNGAHEYHLSAVGATEYYIHINSQSTKPLFSLYLMDIVLFLLSISCSPLLLPMGWFRQWSSLVSTTILDGITSIYIEVGIPRYPLSSLPLSFYITKNHSKKTRSRILLKISHLSCEKKSSCWTTPKKSIRTHTHKRTKRDDREKVAITTQKKWFLLPLSFAERTERLNLAAKQNASISGTM